MSDEVGMVGGLVMGGLAAREIDRAGGTAHGHDLTNCQNCGAHLGGPYCHQCGQSGHVHRTIGHVFEEFAHGVLHVDGKLWRTLPMLVLNPGRLTREYIHGRRVRYIAPLALYLFMVLLTFLVFGFTGGGKIGGESKPMTVADAQSALSDLRTGYQKALADPKMDDTDRAALRTGVGIAEANLERVKRGQGVDRQESGVIEQIKKSARDGSIKVNVGSGGLNNKAQHALENIDLVLYKIQQKAYKLSFLLVPMSLPALWLLFAWKRGVTLYDHTVFVLYSLSFMLLLTCAVVLTSYFGDSSWALLVAPPVHMFAQLKGAYSLRTRSALWRAFVLAVASTVVLGLYLALMVAIGLID